MPDRPDVRPDLSVRSFKIMARPMRSQSFDLIPETLREGDHLVRVSEGGVVIFDTPRGAELQDGLERAFQSIRESIDREPMEREL